MRDILSQGERMHQQQMITTTLGDLIVAVTDEVNSYIHDPSGKYAIVCVVLSDLLTHDRVRLHRLARQLEQEEAEYRSATTRSTAMKNYARKC
jgi:hypothetical protein